MLKHRLRADEGFTLVELLVTILIIGILAAIAVPAFLNQRSKAQHAEAKTMVNTAATAMIIYETERDTFTGATGELLADIDAALGQARNLQIDATARTFEVSVDSQAGGTFTIRRDANGESTRTCTVPAPGACAEDNTW